MPYTYLVQPAQLRNTNRLKFGKSDTNNDDRLKSYGKETVIIRKFNTINTKLVEDNLKMRFKKIFKYVCGNEYFEGDIVEMIEVFDMVCSTFGMVDGRAINKQLTLLYQPEKDKSLFQRESKKAKDELKWFNENLKKTGFNGNNYLVRPLFEKFKEAHEEIDMTFNLFKKKLKEFGYVYRVRVKGVDIKTNQIKQGACVMNAKFVAEEPEVK